MKIFKKIVTLSLALMLVFSFVPVKTVEAASNNVNGGATSQADAYNWGYYSPYKYLTVTLPADEDDFWVSYTLPKDKRIFVKSSYNTDNEGISLEMLDSNNQQCDNVQTTPNNVYDANTILPFLAILADNNTSSASTYYLHVNRGSCQGEIYFTLSMGERIKRGHRTFDFSGTAVNSGNTSWNPLGVNSSVLTLNLNNNSNIPPQAIVKSVETSSTMSPSQGNVHHMIRPVNNSGIWYTSESSSAGSGMYNIDEDDGIEVAQSWQFRYNALATGRSRMRHVKLELEWEYDIQHNGYKNFKELYQYENK